MLCEPVDFSQTSSHPTGYIQLVCALFQCMDRIKTLRNTTFSNILIPSATDIAADIKKYGHFDKSDYVFLFLPIIWIIIRIKLISYTKFFMIRQFPLITPIAGQRIAQNIVQSASHLALFICSSYSILVLRYYYFTDPVMCFKEWSADDVISADIFLNYVIQMSFYIAGVYSTLYVDNWRSDSYLLMFHHFATISLVGLSYAMRLYRIGVFVMFLHDMLDTVLGLAKVFLYLSKFYCESAFVCVSQVLFLTFSILWFVFRLYWYPMKVLYATSMGFAVYSYIPWSWYSILNGFLMFLQFAHIIWSTLIVKALLRRLGGNISDFRETDVTEDRKDKRE